MIEVLNNQPPVLHNHRIVRTVKESGVVKVLGNESGVMNPDCIGKVGSSAFLPGFFKVVVTGAAGQCQSDNNHYNQADKVSPCSM